ncbi:MAG: hypothetical protein ACE5PT_01575 [Gemmatimonadales bacterium]
MTAITLDHITRKLEELKQEMDAGNLQHGEYDQRLARLINELRDRKIDADRAEITSALDDLQGRGVITASVNEHLKTRLGLR